MPDLYWRYLAADELMRHLGYREPWASRILRSWQKYEPISALVWWDGEREHDCTVAAYQVRGCPCLPGTPELWTDETMTQIAERLNAGA